MVVVGLFCVGWAMTSLAPQTQMDDVDLECGRRATMTPVRLGLTGLVAATRAHLTFGVVLLLTLNVVLLDYVFGFFSAFTVRF